MVMMMMFMVPFSVGKTNRIAIHETEEADTDEEKGEDKTYDEACPYICILGAIFRELTALDGALNGSNLVQRVAFRILLLALVSLPRVMTLIRRQRPERWQGQRDIHPHC
jgi:hypothetical protein